MSLPKEKIVCPHCQKPNTWNKENKFRPFCSERCKLIDLGDWASEKRRIPSEDSPSADFPNEEGEK